MWRIFHLFNFGNNENRSWNEKGEFRCSSEFRILLLSMFSLSARHSTVLKAGQHEKNGIIVWEAGDNFSDLVKSMISESFTYFRIAWKVISVQLPRRTRPVDHPQFKHFYS